MIRSFIAAFCLSSSMALAGDALPERFTGFNLTVRHIHELTSDERLTSEPWPFTTNKILIACGDGALAVVRVGTIYAALNGYTSGQRSRILVQETTGRRSPILGTSNNDNFRDAGIVRKDASDVAIGYWWGALLSELLKIQACL
ncbi:hypothetical protein LPW26_25075 [Rhodopseudomonas sp. HC1]|uniref:hypothetical protein n=1 Tax=Rhodopseudomonas infernalis TaxID=2897386 RepID=UPI001EE87A22|nr:hypothetical protein [Rhodopseudomonas infernalis]MCG6207934.1 hypothetical protein [Rhodopseudomonas infernalis]